MLKSIYCLIFGHKWTADSTLKEWFPHGVDVTQELRCTACGEEETKVMRFKRDD